MRNYAPHSLVCPSWPSLQTDCPTRLPKAVKPTAVSTPSDRLRVPPGLVQVVPPSRRPRIAGRISFCASKMVATPQRSFCSRNYRLSQRRRHEVRSSSEIAATAGTFPPWDAFSRWVGRGASASAMRKATARDGMTRAEYEGRAAERRATAQRLRSQGMTVQAIADCLGVCDERVRQLLSETDPSADG